MRLVLLTLVLSACTVPAIVQVQPAPVVVVTPAPVITAPPVPVPVIPARLPTDPLVILDASVLTVTLADSTLTIKLTDDTQGAWVRVLLPDGTVSPATLSPAGAFLGLGGLSAHRIDLSFLPGLRIETALNPTAGPWVLAATTQ